MTTNRHALVAAVIYICANLALTGALTSGRTHAAETQLDGAVWVPAFSLYYVGKLFQEGKPPTVYLGKDREIQAATEGQIVDGVFRIDAIRGDAMDITYLPTRAKQTILYGNITRSPVAPPENTRPIAPSADISGSQPPTPPQVTLMPGAVPREAAAPAPAAAELPFMPRTVMPGAPAGAGMPRAPIPTRDVIR